MAVDTTPVPEEFASVLGITFNNPALLRQAFIHRSYVNEHREEASEHNERLEFLGDAVLELVVTRFLFDTYPDKPEGELTAVRAALVNTITISEAASKLNMGNYLLLSRGEARDTGRARQYILANTFEAVIGAIYLDRGYDIAAEFIAANIFPLAENIVDKRLWQDAKSRFQEVAQEKVSVTPSYEVLREEGPDHDKIFTVAVMLRDEKVAEGKGKSKQEAEQVAAQAGLEARGWV